MYLDDLLHNYSWCDYNLYNLQQVVVALATWDEHVKMVLVQLDAVLRLHFATEPNSFGSC